MRILLIEDEEHIREIAQVSLESIGGWDVLSAASGPEGLDIAQSEKPDAILLDVMMPEMDGPTTLRALREEPSTKDIPVIFMTAKVQPAERRELSDAGAAGIIPKPFDPMTLSSEIADALGWER